MEYQFRLVRRPTWAQIVTGEPVQLVLQVCSKPMLLPDGTNAQVVPEHIKWSEWEEVPIVNWDEAQDNSSV